jgi:hypothetical protein
MIRRVLVDGWSVEDAELQAKVIGLKSSSLNEFALDYIRRHETARRSLLMLRRLPATLDSLLRGLLEGSQLTRLT